MSKYKVTFPQLGNYRIPLEVLFTVGMDVDYVTPPPITRRTLDLGSRHSPDFVCAPFKYCLGNYIEAIEQGANTLIQTGGACRLGFYGELHEQILRDLGYEFRFINLAKARLGKPASWYQAFKEINPDISVNKIAAILPTVIRMTEYIDRSEDYIRKNVGFERVDGSFARAHQAFLEQLRYIRNRKELNGLYQAYYRQLNRIETRLPERPLRVGIVGEYYTIMEPFSNHDMEKALARMGIIIDRWLCLSHSMDQLSRKTRRAMKEHIRDYARFNMGATSMATVNQALKLAKSGYDGIIHVKSFGCTPEMDAMPVLQNISRDYKIPILYFSFDSQTSETGIQTRLEAFFDMMMMRKEAKA